MKWRSDVMPSTLVEVGQFCRVNNTEYEKYGVKKGQLVYVAGSTLSPIESDDPYLLRKLFIAAYMKDNHIQVKDKPFLVNGVSLTPVSDSKQKELDAIRAEDFKKVAEDETSN